MFDKITPALELALKPVVRSVVSLVLRPVVSALPGHDTDAQYIA